MERVREVYRGRTFRLVCKDLRFPGGHRATYGIVQHPGAVAILPVFANGDVMFVRQYRVAVGKPLLELPAGTLERGESPLHTAKREVVEETGYCARKWRKIGEFYTAPGFCTELMHVYVATILKRAYAPGDPDEEISAVRLPLSRALAFVRNGRIRDAKTIAGLLLYHGQRHEKAR